MKVSINNTTIVAELIDGARTTILRISTDSASESISIVNAITVDLNVVALRFLSSITHTNGINMNIT